MRQVALICLVLATAGSAAPSRLLVAGGSWASFDRGAACEAVAKPLAPPRGQDAQPHVTLAFDRGGPRLGQIFIRLRRPARPGSTVMLVVGSQPFQLVVAGASAWSRSAAQESAIMSAMRGAGDMRVTARDASGRRMTDRYLLAGAQTAIDAAAAACSQPRT